jgi:hypothetical protein
MQQSRATKQFPIKFIVIVSRERGRGEGKAKGCRMKFKPDLPLAFHILAALIRLPLNEHNNYPSCPCSLIGFVSAY